MTLEKMLQNLHNLAEHTSKPAPKTKLKKK